MYDVVSLVIPFFGLVFAGFALARITRQPLDALGWMNTFVIYVALPALFFQLVSKTPIEQLTAWGFIFATVLSTYSIFATGFVVSIILSRGDIATSMLRGLASAYGNIGYMGPGIALVALGEQAAVPVALIFCFENVMHFAIAPTMMALAGDERRRTGPLIRDVALKIVLHPFIVATALGIAAAALAVKPPLPIDRFLDLLSRAAAPCALFAMGVTLALRPLRGVPVEIAPIALLKLVVHPCICYVMVSWIGNYPPSWVYAAVLLASLPTATNVFVIAQQYRTWVQRASATVFVTTCLSVASVTVLLYLITHGILPPDLFPKR